LVLLRSKWESLDLIGHFNEVVGIIADCEGSEP
jgi:hypothetical protein